MILYVNGCSHTAAAEAVNPHAFACDDGALWQLGRRPHPDNELVSWGYRLSGLLGAAFVNQSESASSNYRIMRTCRAWLESNPETWQDVLVIIQWSTWEREEWLIEDQYYQIGASGLDHVPPELQDRYREFVLEVDWPERERFWHQEIWQLHRWLKRSGIRHVFFNGNNHFGTISDPKSWSSSYLDPYCVQGTWDWMLRSHGFATVDPKSWHFGADAHCFWSRYLLQYCIDNHLVEQCDIS
jgi:hypothetical protein